MSAMGVVIKIEGSVCSPVRFSVRVWQVEMGVRTGRGEMIYGDSTAERYDGIVRCCTGQLRVLGSMRRKDGRRVP